MIRRRRRLARAEQQQLWSRWVAGDSLEALSRGLQAAPSGLYGVIVARGGIPPIPRHRAPHTLSTAERGVIARLLRAQHSLRQIARVLGRAPSTISREVRRHGARTATTRHYDAAVADGRAWHRAERPKRSVLATRPLLRRLVARRLAQQWSPAQIAGWLRGTYPGDASMQVSAETIYRSLYVQARGVLRRELTGQLRRGRRVRRSQGRRPTARPGVIVDGVSIAARPGTVADRAIPGHWEGDLLAGSHQSYIATLVERASRFVVLVKVPSKASVPVVDALIRCARRLPAGLMHSLTWDRGVELAQHRRFTVATDVAVYFCDPRSPWQRGTNENTNGLLRQYFPKGQDLTAVTQMQLDRVARRLNTRPRQTLGFRTPAAVLAEHVASIG
jgi:IS30 family transposase